MIGIDRRSLSEDHCVGFNANKLMMGGNGKAEFYAGDRAKARPACDKNECLRVSFGDRKVRSRFRSPSQIGDKLLGDRPGVAVAPEIARQTALGLQRLAD